MWTTDAVTPADPQLVWLVDRLDLLSEVESLAATIVALEQQQGGPELDELRRRVQRVRGVVIAQLRQVFDELETVH